MLALGHSPVEYVGRRNGKLIGRDRHLRHFAVGGHTFLRSALLCFALTLMGLSGAGADELPFWSPFDVANIKKLSIAELRPLPPDPSNRVADDPKAADLGEAFFFDARFSANGDVSCATCHVPDRQFQDDRRVGRGISDAARRTLPLAGAAYAPFFFWDGRKDSMWSQALGPLESPAEHGADRAMAVHLIAANYRAQYEALFGKLPDFNDLPAHASPLGSSEAVANWVALTDEEMQEINLVFANLGKAIEAFERTIPVPATRFDAYAAAVVANDMAAADQIFSQTERNGLQLFLHQGDCVRCHSGPLLTDQNFYNLGLPGTNAKADEGRSAATDALADDPFNCLGEFSDANPKRHCLPLKLLAFDKPENLGAFKSPTLRGTGQRPPYMHTGQFASLRDVLKHYNEAPVASFGKSDLPNPRKLNEAQLLEIEAFLRTLDVADNSAE